MSNFFDQLCTGTAGTEKPLKSPFIHLFGNLAAELPELIRGGGTVNAPPSA
jgi:hypothetical protein